MAEFLYKDLYATYMALSLAKSRNAYTESELADVDKLITKLYEFVEHLKIDVESRTTVIEDLEPDQ